MDTQGYIELRATPTESRSAHDQDVQKVGRDLFFHRLMRNPRETSADRNTLIDLAGCIFATQSALHGYVVPEPPLSVSEVHAVSLFCHNERYDDEFRFLAKRGSISTPGMQSEGTALLIDDYREDGVVVDWDRARKLYLRMIAK